MAGEVGMMDAAAFEQVYGSFRDFHAYFAPLLGRRETREHSGNYLQPCWYSLGSGATLRTCRNGSGQPEGCSGFSPILPGTMR